MEVDSRWPVFSISEPGHLLVSIKRGKLDNISMFCNFRRFEKIFECSYALKFAKLGFYKE